MRSREETELGADFGNFHFRVLKQIRRTFHPNPVEKIANGFARGALVYFRQIDWMQAYVIGDGLQRYAFGKMSLYIGSNLGRDLLVRILQLFRCYRF